MASEVESIDALVIRRPVSYSRVRDWWIGRSAGDVKPKDAKRLIGTAVKLALD